MTASPNAKVRYPPVTPRPRTPTVIRIAIEGIQKERHKFAWDASIARGDPNAGYRFSESLKTYDGYTHAIDLLETLLEHPEVIDRLLSETKGNENQLTLDI